MAQEQKNPKSPAQGKGGNKRFWDFRAAADENAAPELILYGDIASETWWGDEVTPLQFTEELNALGNVPEIVVRINSGGGDVFAANAIYTRLKDNAAKITVKIDGWAASAATIVAMAGDVIEIPGNGVFMVHDPAIGLLGYFNEADLAKASEELKVIKQSIINGYALKTGKAVVVNGGNGVRVRSGPGTSYDILATVPNGGSVQVVRATGTDDWYEITFTAVGGVTTTGYMKGEFLANS